MITGATISPDGVYRYSLERMWNDGGPLGVTWVMLNPSTADATVDDATIRVCIDFSQRWGYDWLRVVNLFAFRATKPQVLTTADDPVGPDNMTHVIKALKGSRITVVAWGANWSKVPGAGSVIEHLKGQDHPLYCLGTTKDGSPRHPLYIARTTQPMIWSCP